MAPNGPPTRKHGTPESRPQVARARVLLTSLVPFHQALIAHGAPGSWFFRDPSLPRDLMNPALSVTAAVDQAHFMAGFLFISGLFTPKGVDSKGPGQFFADRARRLGPAVGVYLGFVGPVTRAVCAAELAMLGSNRTSFEPLRTWIPRFAGSLGKELFQKKHFIASVGPLWFVLALLSFSGGYSLARLLGLAKPTSTPAPETKKSLLLKGATTYTLITAPSSFLTRLIFPVSGLPAPFVPIAARKALDRMGWQLGYFPGYIAAFSLGCVAARHMDVLFDDPDDRTADRLLGFSVSCIPLLPIAALTIGLAEFDMSKPIPGLVYAAWEPLVCVGITSWLLFGQYPLWTRVLPADSEQRIHSLLETMTRASFATYVFHPIATVLASIVAPHLSASLGFNWPILPVLLRAGLGSTAAITGSWALGIGVKGLPWVGELF